MKVSVFNPEKYNNNYFNNITIQMDSNALTNALTELTSYIHSHFRVDGNDTVSSLTCREVMQLHDLISYSLDKVAVLCSQAASDPKNTDLQKTIQNNLNVLKFAYIAAGEVLAGFGDVMRKKIVHQDCDELLLLSDIYNAMVLRTDVLFSQLIFGENIVTTASIYNIAQSVLHKLDPKSYGSFKITDTSKIEETKARFEKIIIDCKNKVTEYEMNLWKYFSREAIQVESEVKNEKIESSLNNLAMQFISTPSIKYIFREVYLTQYFTTLMTEQSKNFTSFLDKVKKYCASPDQTLVKLDDVMAVFQELSDKEKEASDNITKKTESLKTYISIIEEAQKAKKDVLVVARKKNAPYNIPKDYNTKFITAITSKTPDIEVEQKMIVIIDNLSERLLVSDVEKSISLDEIMKITRFTGLALRQAMRLSTEKAHLFQEDAKTLKILLNQCFPIIWHHTTKLAEENSFEAFQKTHDLLRVLLEQVEVSFKSNNMRNAILALNEIVSWTTNLLGIISTPSIFDPEHKIKPEALIGLKNSFYQLNSDCRRELDECHLNLWKFYANVALFSICGEEGKNNMTDFPKLDIHILFEDSPCTVILQSAETQMWFSSLDRTRRISKKDSELMVAYKDFLRKINEFSASHLPVAVDCHDILKIFALCKTMMENRKIGANDEFASNNIQKLADHIEDITILKDAVNSSAQITKMQVYEETAAKDVSKSSSSSKGGKPVKKEQQKVVKEKEKEKEVVKHIAALNSIQRNAPLPMRYNTNISDEQTEKNVEKLSTMKLNNNANKAKLVESVASVLSNNASSSSSSKPNVSVAAQACNNLIAAKKEKKADAILPKKLQTMLNEEGSASGGADDVGTSKKQVIESAVQVTAAETKEGLAQRISKVKFNANAPAFEMPVQQAPQQQNPQIPMPPPLMPVMPVAGYMMYSPITPQGVFVPVCQHPTYYQQMQYQQQQQNDGQQF